MRSLSKLLALPLALALGVAGGLGLTHWLHGDTLGPGISGGQAIDAARAQGAPWGQVTVVSARAGRLRDFEFPGSSTPGHDDDLVWAVLVRGSFPFPSCGPPPTPGQPDHPCPSPAQTMMMMFDYRTGTWLWSEMPASR